ncbi:MAG: DUF3820 family protein [Ferruginibacter sp.]
MNDFPLPDPAFLISLVQTKMPFGKYKDQYLYKLPVSYLEWFERKGFSERKTGNAIAGDV